MDLQQFSDTPFQLQISFHKVIEALEQTAAAKTGYEAEAAKALLKQIEPYPELRDGITDWSQIDNNLEVIRHLLSGLFPAALTHNEIKAVTIPFHDVLINQTERFKGILENAGPDFDLTIRDFDEHQFYVMCCCMILNEFYGTNLDFSRPLFYDIPSADGIVKHYRILYNGDFMDVIPTEKAKQLTQDEVDLLMNNYDDVALWKEKFPKESYIMKGFAIINLFDATVENAVSSLKETLLSTIKEPTINEDLESVFRSIFRIPDLRIGFTTFDRTESKFNAIAFPHKVNTFILGDVANEPASCVLCGGSFDAILKKGQYFSISDCDQFLKENPDSVLAKRLLSKNIKSFILAPVIKNDALLGVLELVSYRKNELNSVNALKLEVVMPFLINTIDRKLTDLQHEIQAVIQNEYTTLHPSVQWKFRQEAQKFIDNRNQQLDYVLKEVVFEDVYPLYGQIDIKGSSDSRNESLQKDMSNQLGMLTGILQKLKGKSEEASLHLQRLTEFKTVIDDFSAPVKTDTEQYIQYYIESNVHPVLARHTSGEANISSAIANYFKQLDKKTGNLFAYRQKYDTTISVINQKMATLLDLYQADAQEIYPHYFERFKTDGVEHNMYVGASITPNRPFTLNHLHDLRLWQLQVLCEMEREHQRLKPALPYQLDVTTLIFAFSAPISIRFRMDEKRFDVDGTYNARFEVVKKRIDKANIKGTYERITQPGKVTIVFSNELDEAEYRKYIALLQADNVLDHEIELLDVEDLQSVSGLKALRVKILHD